jgi:hypothetical protein
MLVTADVGRFEIDFNTYDVSMVTAAGGVRANERGKRVNESWSVARGRDATREERR